MVKQSIQIFARLKPTKARLGVFEVEDDNEGNPRLTFVLPRNASDGLVNNKKEQYKFRFQKIFNQDAKQEEVFEHVARPVIDSVLDGYNGTIFAYGQTGSGKTFSITGGPEKYSDRGIIPRTLGYIFQQYSNANLEYTTHISYLEIYNESGYDLLDPAKEASKLEDLPKVTLMEDSDQNIHLKNLSLQPCSNEEDALNFLFMGDTNRMIAETPMNMASTRSHCIFTIHMTSREVGSATIRRSKLHLVDLAGSERVGKTGVDGKLLSEAKYINLSLHFLESCIVALGEKKRAHIPYRNSMMTSVLRDSLGGNCMTSMIATCSVEKPSIDESISTCRFAQRVALIKNDALLNEELDPKLLIVRLKKEVASLKDELALATGEQREDELTDEEKERCKEIVQAYLNDNDKDASMPVGADVRKIQYCYSLLKEKYLEKPKENEIDTSRSSRPVTSDRMSEIDIGDSVNHAEVQKLRDLCKQRDNEIAILVDMLKKEKARAAHKSVASETKSSQNGFTRPEPPTDNGQRHRSSRPPSSRSSHSKLKIDDKLKSKVIGDLSTGRQEAFEIFRRDYEGNNNIEEQKQRLKLRYAEAKSLGELVQTSRGQINNIKAQIDRYRMTKVMQGSNDSENQEPDDNEMMLRQNMETEKAGYKETFSKLRTLKTEIEHLQHFMEKSKVKLMKDFELWWAEQTVIAQEKQARLQKPKNVVTDAWRSSVPSESSYSLNSERSVDSLQSGTIAGSYGGSMHSVASSASGYRSGSAQKKVDVPVTSDPRANDFIKNFYAARDKLNRQT